MTLFDPVSRLDEGALTRLAASVGADHMAETIDRVLQSTKAAWDQIRHCASRGDFARIVVIADELKSDCARMGADGLAQRLGGLEAKVRDPDRVESVREINAILAELNCFLEDLRRARNTEARRVSARV